MYLTIVDLHYSIALLCYAWSNRFKVGVNRTGQYISPFPFPILNGILLFRQAFGSDYIVYLICFVLRDNSID